VKRWRKIEAARHPSPEEGERQAQALITVRELRSIVDTRKFRVGEKPKGKRWVHVPRYTGQRGLPQGVVSVNADRQRIHFGPWAQTPLAEYGSCDLFVCGTSLRIVFAEGATGDHRRITKVGTSAIVSANAFFLAHPEIEAGRYEACWVLPGELEIDFAAPIGALRVRRQKVAACAR